MRLVLTTNNTDSFGWVCFLQVFLCLQDLNVVYGPIHLKALPVFIGFEADVNISDDLEFLAFVFVFGMLVSTLLEEVFKLGDPVK